MFCTCLLNLVQIVYVVFLLFGFGFGLEFPNSRKDWIMIRTQPCEGLESVVSRNIVKNKDV